MISYLSPKLDVVFKMIFERNPALLGNFLLSILDIPEGGIEGITILNPISALDGPEEKKSIMDVKVEFTAGHSSNVEIQMQRRANVELQARNLPGIIPRLHYYKARMVTEQLSSGDPYEKLLYTSCVAVLDFKLYGDGWCHHAFRYYDKKHDVEFSPFEEIHVIEIPKLEQDTSNRPLWYWLKFMNATEKEEFDMLSEQSEVMKQAVGVLASLSADDKARMLAEARERELRDQMSRERGAKEEGIREGKREGLREGKREGLREGKREGLREGKRESQLEIARNMLRFGISMDVISQTTGLNESEVRRIKQ